MNALTSAFQKYVACPPVPPIRRGVESSWVNVEGGTVSGRVTKVVGVEDYFASVYDSAAQCRFRIGADADGRHGFATAQLAQDALDRFLLETLRMRGTR